MSHHRPRLWRGVLAGLAGGVAASFAMNRFQTAIEKASQSNEERSASPPPDEPATVKAAEAVSSNVFGHELRPSEKTVAGPAVHYGFGAAMGALYGALAEYTPAVRLGMGLLFGATVWLVADEIGVPFAGLSKPPAEYPASTHASALAAHLVYGMTAERVRRAIA